MATKKPEQPVKPWYKSTTLLINGVGIALTVAEFAVASNLIPDPEYLALAIAVINIANRFRNPKTVAKLSR